MTETAPSHRFTLMGRDIEFDPIWVSPADAGAVQAPTFPLLSLALDISGSCNLACRYCAESATLPSRPPMTEGVLRRSLDLLFGGEPVKRAVSIHFGSGEPLLRAPLLRLAGELARRKEQETGIQAHLYLTTNGTLVDDEVLEFLRRDAWNVKVSIDGPPAVHDRCRVDTRGKPTSAAVSGALRRLLDLMPGSLSTTSVLCHGTDPARVFSFLAGMGVQRIELVPVASRGPSGAALTGGDLEIYRRFIADYAARLAAGEDHPMQIRFQKRLQKVLGFFNGSIACDAGRTFLAAGPDGDLYPCFRFVGLGRYRLGRLETGISDGSRAPFTREAGRPYQERACSGCWAGPLCGGPCFAVTELMCGGNPDPVYCSLVRSEAEAALWLADVLRESDPGRLLQIAGIPAGVDDEGPAR